MSKKRRAKSSLLPRILVCVGILLAIAAIIFPAMDALMLETVTKNLITGEVLSTSQEPLLTGFQVAFGTEISNDYFSVQTLEPSGGTIAFLALLAAGLLAGLLALALKWTHRRKGALILGLAAGLLLVVGGVGFFFLPQIAELKLSADIGFAETNVVLGPGAYLPAIFGISGGVLVAGGSALR